MPDNRCIDSPEIELYADGSCRHELGFGTWAFIVPKLRLEATGTSDGNTASRFELLAVLHGLEAIAATDTSDAHIHIFTDCESTVDAINRFCTGLVLKNPSRYEDRLDLLPRLRSLLVQRSVRVTRVGVGPIEHQNCHRNALTRLRQELEKSPKARYRLALARHERRMAQLAGERGTILKRLEKIEEDIALLGAEIEALKAALANSEESIPAATRLSPQSDSEDAASPARASVSVQ